MLSHYARFKAWIPFYTTYIRYCYNVNLLQNIIASMLQKKFNVQVAEDLYMRRDYQDTIFNIIRESELRPDKRHINTAICHIIF